MSLLTDSHSFMNKFLNVQGNKISISDGTKIKRKEFSQEAISTFLKKITDVDYNELGKIFFKRKSLARDHSRIKEQAIKIINAAFKHRRPRAIEDKFFNFIERIYFQDCTTAIKYLLSNA